MSLNIEKKNIDTILERFGILEKFYNSTIEVNRNE